MSETLVTVLIAAYNQGKYIRQALESLKAQTLSSHNFEVIVINDGSTDETQEILRDYKGWIRLVERENQGLVASCNQGLSLARGSYFTRLDSDDFVALEWLATLTQALRPNPDACCACPDRYEVYGNQWHRVWVQPVNLYSLVACGTLFATDVLRKVGGFRSFYWEEYDLYLRLRQAGELIHVPEPLYMYRRHNRSMTHDVSQRIEGWLQLAREWGVETLQSAGFHPDLDKVLRGFQG